MKEFLYGWNRKAEWAKIGIVLGLISTVLCLEPGWSSALIFWGMWSCAVIYGLTVNHVLIEVDDKTSETIKKLKERTGLSDNEIFRRSYGLYNLVDQVNDEGGSFKIYHPNGEIEDFDFLKKELH